MKTGNRGVFSNEANVECAERLDDPLYVFDTKGVNNKFISLEAVQCLYTMSIPPNNKSKTLRKDKVSEILSKNNNELTVKYILKDLGLGEFPNKEKECELNDIVILEKGDYKGIKKQTETTIGKLLINKVIFEPIDYEYQNEVFDKKKISYHLNYIGSKVLSKDIEMKEYKKLLNRFEDFSLRMSSFVNPSLSSEMMNIDKSILDLRDKLIKENKEAIENGDTEIVSEIEDELIDKVKEVYSDNPQMLHYLSGAKPRLNNSYKKNAIMVGAVPANLNSTKFNVTTSNYMQGLKKSDIHKVSSAMILGGYFRAKNTAVGGYLNKLGTRVLQGIRADKYGSDCGTTKYREISVTENNFEEYIDAYMVDSDGLTLLTYDNIKNFIGKNIEIRYPIGCTSEMICNKCLGDRYYKLLNEYDKPIDVGLFVNKMFTELTQKSLKKTHQMTLEYYHLDDMNEFIV